MDNIDDPFVLTAEEIIQRLEQKYGVEDAANMDENERMCLFLSLIVEDEEPTPASAPAASADGELLDTNDTRQEALDPVSDTTSSDKEAGLVMSLCDISGTDPESARHLLEALAWDLTAAVALLCTEGQTSPGRSAPQGAIAGQDTVSGGMQTSSRNTSFADIGEGTWRDVDPQEVAVQEPGQGQGPGPGQQNMIPNGWMTQQAGSRSVWGDIMMAGGGLGHHFVGGGGGEGMGYEGNFEGDILSIHIYHTRITHLNNTRISHPVLT